MNKEHVEIILKDIQHKIELVLKGQEVLRKEIRAWLEETRKQTLEIKKLMRT